MNKNLDRTFCIAPMMGYTTPYARQLYRMLSKKTFLFTEMIATKTLLLSTTKDFIIEKESQNPIALQVGGSEVSDLIKITKIAYSYNYDEINLNVGCPGKAVLKGKFGACLMEEKLLVRECLEAMNNVNKINVSLKCRIGLGKRFNYNFFAEFIDEVTKSGIDVVYVHARNVNINGISPKENRSIPPLNYDFVRKIKLDFPKIKFILNGGIKSLNEALSLRKEFDGVMIGRLIQNNPFCLIDVDELFFNSKNQKKIKEKIILEYFYYIKQKLKMNLFFV